MCFFHNAVDNPAKVALEHFAFVMSQKYIYI